MKEKDTKETLNKADQQVLQAQTEAQRALLQQQQAMAAAQQHAAQQAAVQQQHQAMTIAAAQAAQMGQLQQQGQLRRLVSYLNFSVAYQILGAGECKSSKH